MSSDPIGDAGAAAASASNPGSPLTNAKIASVNDDGTLGVDFGDGNPVGIYTFATYVPVVGMVVQIMTSPAGVQYALGPVRTGTQLSATEAAYPIGKRWISGDPTNPADVLGFGTWVAASEGRVVMGAGTSDETYSAGSTGGQSNFGIDASHLPTASPWTVHDPGHSHAITGGGATYYIPGGSTFFLDTTGVFNVQTAAGPTTAAATTTGVSLNTNAGGGNELPTLPPYEVVYIFKRTA